MTASLAVLGLLVEQPRHGYALDRVIEERGMRRWAGIGFSSIYWVIDQLVREGFVEVTTESTGGRTRRVVHPTPAGRRHWQERCLAALARPGRSDEEFLVALAGLPGLEAASARRALEARATALDRAIDELEAATEVADPAAPPHARALFAYSHASLVAQRDWLRGFLAGVIPGPPRGAGRVTVGPAAGRKRRENSP